MRQLAPVRQVDKDSRRGVTPVIRPYAPESAEERQFAATSLVLPLPSGGTGLRLPLAGDLAGKGADLSEPRPLI